MDDIPATLESGREEEPSGSEFQNQLPNDKRTTSVPKKSGAGVEVQLHDSKQAAGQTDIPAEKAGRRFMKFSYPSGSKPLDGYTIKRGIGIGGFGEVYFALSDAGKEVALKKIQRNLDVELRGVRQCLNLKHVNLISLWDIRINEHGESWVVMEYVPGPSLRDTVEANLQGMPEEDVKTWFSSTASGVAYLHEQGIVHRDLKPGNIFRDDDEQVIKIGDYGLSKFISCSRRSGQTESVGTFHYMAPEIGKGIYGKEIDIYALGIILFEMLTGDVPFDGESSQEIIMKHLTTDPDVSSVPVPFRKVIAKALRKDPELRYDTVQEMVADLPWPEIAKVSQNIVSKNSVGPMVTPNANRETAEHPGIEPNQNRPPVVPAEKVSADATGNIVSQLPPVIISGDEIEIVPDIVFGQLRDSTRQPGSVQNQNGFNQSNYEPPPPVEDPIRVVRKSVHPVGQRPSNSGAPNLRLSSPSNPAQPLASVATVETAQERVQPEPIATAVRTGFSNANQWWGDANVSTPVKIGLLIIAGVVVIKNSQWLLPLILFAAMAYLIYYIVRTLIFDSGKSNGPTAQELARQSQITVRNWIGSQPSVDRVTELIGSLLLAAFACIVLNLLGFALGGELLGDSIEPWAKFAWLTVTSVIGSWALLICGKSWEHRVGEQWLRRIAMVGIGLGVGAFAFFSAGIFSLDLTQMALEDFKARGTEQFVLHGLSLLPAYLIFFAVLFGILRWWRQTDPVRKTRLSVLSVLICLIWATVFSHLLNLPLTGNCVLAVVISVSSQLASRWLHPDEREEICADSVGSGMHSQLLT